MLETLGTRYLIIPTGVASATAAHDINPINSRRARRDPSKDATIKLNIVPQSFVKQGHLASRSSAIRLAAKPRFTTANQQTAL
jgi:hypothetical protein